MCYFTEIYSATLLATVLLSYQLTDTDCSGLFGTYPFLIVLHKVVREVRSFIHTVTIPAVIIPYFAFSVCRTSKYMRCITEVV